MFTKIQGCMAAGAALLLLGVTYQLVSARNIDHDRVYRIGYGLSPPLHYADENGKPAGLAVEMVREAARRQNIKLDWVRPTNPGMPSIQSGEADFWVLMTDTRERRKFVYITEPFLVTEYCFLVRKESPYRSLDDLANARIVATSAGIDRLIVGKLIKQAKLTTAPSAKPALEQFLSGSQDALFLDQIAASDLALTYGFDGPVRILQAPTPRSYMGLAANKKLQAVADGIRGELTTMAAEGRLAPLVGARGFFPVLNLEAIQSLSSARRRERYLLWGITSLIALLSCTLALIVSLRTERNKLKVAESALLDTSKYHRTLIELLPDTIYVGSRDTAVEGGVCAYRDDPALTWLLDSGDHRDRVKEVVSSGSIASGEATTPDGRYLEYRLVPLSDSSGNTSGVLGILRDKTTQKRAEEDRLKLEEKLRQAQKMEGVGRLAGGVAHDFNNLLTIIIGYASMLIAENPDDSATCRNLEHILIAGNRAADLTQQLLAFSRRQVIQPKLTDLNQIVVESTNMLGRLLGSDIVLKTMLTPGLSNVLIDRGQFIQVLMNLAANARDAMPEGGFFSLSTAQTGWSAMDARAHMESVPGECVVIEVTDSGQGMDDETVSKIFEPFFTTKAEGRGTGLGLATVYGIIRQAGGWIHVESALELGTTFQIYLPVSTGSEQPQELQDNHDCSNDYQAAGTVLIVEDQEDIRMLETKILKGAGYDVVSTCRPEDALLASERFAGRIDLLLTDIVMPGMRGPELARRIRRQRPEIKLLFASGYAGELHAGRDQLILESTLLPKPFGAQALLDSVAKCMNGMSVSLTGS
jgi:signal transduction histidine kinase/ABC-type amino acid transport substrate-binding protein/CheY-like chemotaxis protein